MKPLVRYFFRFRGEVVGPRSIARNNEVKKLLSYVDIFLKEPVNALRLLISPKLVVA